MKILIFSAISILGISFGSAQSDKVVTRSVVKTESDTCAGSSDTFTFHYEVSYPFFSDNKDTKLITDSLNKYVRVIAGNYFMDSSLSKSLISVIKKESDSVHNTWVHDLAVKFCYNLENTETIELLYADKKFCTLVNDWYAYDGGAHGLDGEDYIVLNAHTGKKIESWKELFGDTNVVKTIAKTEFYKLKKRDQCDSADWFWGGDFYVSDNFAVLKEGILFYYQTYEIAPYAFGPTELFLTWEMLKKAKVKKKI